METVKENLEQWQLADEGDLFDGEGNRVASNEPPTDEDDWTPDNGCRVASNEPPTDEGEWGAEYPEWATITPIAPVATPAPTPVATPAPTPVATPAPTPVKGLQLTRMSDIKPVQTTWLWAERIPQGALTLLSGAEGQGKSTLALDLAAQLTRGELAGDLAGEPSSVIYITTEDGLDNVVRPRLQAMGADLDKVHTIGYHGDSLDSLTDQIGELGRVIVESGARLIILDPLVSAMTDIDTFKPGPVRKALEPFIALLKRENVACVGVLHTNRGESRVALDRISESKAFTRIARAAIGFAPDPSDENYRVVGLMKSNQSSTKLPLMRVKIESATIRGERGETIQTSRLAWCGEAEGSASEIFNPTPVDDKEERDNVDRFLVELLSESPANNDTISKALKSEGHSLSGKQIQRALKRVGATVHARGGNRPTEYVMKTLDT